MALRDWSEKKLLALTAGVVGAILVVMAGGLFYVYSEYGKHRSELDKLNGQADALRKKVATLDDRRKELADLKQKEIDDRRRIPDEKELRGLTKQVTELIRHTGIRLEKLGEAEKPRGARRSQPSGAGGPCAPVKMHMEGTGKFHSFGQFLNRLENRIDRIVAVKGFEITGNEYGLIPEQSTVEIKLDFEAYRYKTVGKK